MSALPPITTENADIDYVGFSNRPIGVKRFQAIHYCSVDAARRLVLLSGIGTEALPSWDSRRRWNDLSGGLAGRLTAGPSRHANSPHPSSREGHHSTARWSSSFPPIGSDPVRLSCACGGVLFAGPAELSAVDPDAMHDHSQPPSQDDLVERTNMMWAASYSMTRIISSPHREIAPVRSISPD